MKAHELLGDTINDVCVEVCTYEKGNGALVFVADEYAGSAERDGELGTWTAFPMSTEPGSDSSDGLWGAVQRLVHVHLTTAFKRVLGQ